MTPEVEALVEEFQALIAQITGTMSNLLLPSRLTQVAILVGCLVLAWLLRVWLGGRMREWMHSLEGRPKWQLRALVMVHRQLLLIFFVTLAWAATWAMRSIYVFPSRSYILALIATLALALLVVAFVTRLVRNRALRVMVRWGLWAYVTLHFLELTEQVGTFLDTLAVELGEFRLSALVLLQAVVLIGIGLTAARLLSQVASGRIRANRDISPSMQVLGIKLLQILLYGSVLVIGLRALGLDLTGLAFLSGAIGVGLGFGLQKVVSNLVSGLIILVDKSIKPGDVITLGNTFGWISALSARYVSVVTRDGREYLIPNEDLITGQVVNWSHSDDYIRLDIHFGTSYADDPHLVRRVAIQAAGNVKRVLAVHPPVCHIVAFGDSSINYVLRFWIRDPSGGLTNIRGNVYLALWDAFKEEGIQIPFPQREVRLLNDGATTPAD